MFKNERMREFRSLVNSYKEIDKQLINIRYAIMDLEKLSYNDDIIFLEVLTDKVDNMFDEFLKVKNEIIEKVKKL